MLHLTTFHMLGINFDLNLITVNMLLKHKQVRKEIATT